jgi:hypothetical protein
MMLHSVGCLWQNLGRVHHILEALEKELEKQGKLASPNEFDRGNGIPLAGGRGR